LAQVAVLIVAMRSLAVSPVCDGHKRAVLVHVHTGAWSWKSHAESLNGSVRK